MIICFREKWDDRLVEGPDAETICCYVLKGRIDSGEYDYSPEWTQRAKDALLKKQAMSFMTSRSGYEYEDFYVANVERAV